MIRLQKICFMALISIFLFHSYISLYASNKRYSIDSIQIFAEIYEDGSISIEEIRNYTFQGKFSWAEYKLPLEIIGPVSQFSLSEDGVNYIEADGNLLAEISLLGRIHQIPEMLFFRRAHKNSYTAKSWSNGFNFDDRVVWWTQTWKLAFPHFRSCFEYFMSVNRHSLKWSQRLLCYAQIVKWFAKRGWILMCMDVGVNLIGRSRLGHKFAPFVKRMLDASARSKAMEEIK